MSTVEAVPAAQPQLPPPPPQPRPRRRGPANATVAMVLAGLLLFVATYLLLRDREITYRVAVAATDLRPGTVLGRGAFAIVDVKVDEAVLEGLVTADQLVDREGWVAANNLAKGELVGPGDLRAPAAPSDLRAMSVPIEPARAVAGELEVGDRVDVIATVAGLPSYVAVDLEVIGVTTPGEGALQASTASALTVAVNPGQGLALAQALSGGELDVLRSTGAQVVELASPSAAALAAPTAVPTAAPSASAAPSPGPPSSPSPVSSPSPASSPSPTPTRAAGG